MALGQDQLYNLQGPVQNKNVGLLSKTVKSLKQSIKPSAAILSLGLSTRAQTARPRSQPCPRNGTGAEVTKMQNDSNENTVTRVKRQPRVRAELSFTLSGRDHCTLFYREVSEAQKGKYLPKATQLARSRTWFELR